MLERWNPYEIQLSCFMVLAVLSEIRECDAFNPERLALLEFRERIEHDPYGAFTNWNYNNSEPCLWLGVQCVNGKVQMLDLSGFSLQGTLAPALRKLRYMRSIVMSNNLLSGPIPKEFGELKLLELLDLSHNNLSGTVPIEIGGMPSLKCLLLYGNNLHGDTPPAIGKLDYLLESECNVQLKSIVTGAKYYIQKTGICILWHVMNQFKNYFGIKSLLRNKYGKCCSYADGNTFCHIVQSSAEGKARRRLLGESSNLVAAPAPAPGNAAKLPQQGTPVLFSSGYFPAIIKKPPEPIQPSPQPSHDHPKQAANGPPTKIVYIVVALTLTLVLLVTMCLALLVIRRHRAAKVARAHAANLLHRLSKAFVTGVPRLNSLELQTACEDFSNIIYTFSGCLMYKGILSSGTEIAVLCTSIRSLQQWSNHAEREFKRKLDTFSKINHKNFVNVIGYCEEEDPFVRMMVFEYAPNGNLYEHLHVKDTDHLDWTTRMRIIMGTCYCLEHMHHDLNPPVIHPNLQSDSILLTDDYAAKVADVAFWADIVAKAKISDNEESEPLHSNPGPNREDNVYSLGILLLEIISTKSLNLQAKEYLNNKKEYSKLVDPTLKSFKNDELEVICEIIHECISNDPRQRPTLKDITSRLNTVIKISQEAATSRFSPLWWAELEILSMESG